MESLLTIDGLITLAMLILLQAVLGFDNLLYITLESKRVKPQYQSTVRKVSIGMAVALRLILLFALIEVIRFFQDPIGTIDLPGILQGTFNVHSLVVLIGGVFILYTAVKEIWHMLSLEDTALEQKAPSSVFKTVAVIVVMNVVFSFDSILSAMALTDVFVLMAIAIIVGGVLMVWLADHVSEFLQKNRMYEVLGLFILFLVGVLLLSEGAHLSHLYIAGSEITAMSKATFYFVIGVLVITDVVQSRYQRNLQRVKQSHQVLKSGA